MEKIKFSKKRINLGKFSGRLAKNSFLTFFCFLLIIVALGGLIYYKYVILIKSSSASVQVKPLETQEKTYQEVLDEWAKRDEKFLQAETKEYPYLFQSPVSTSTEELTE